MSTRYWTKPEEFRPERFLEPVPVTVNKKIFPNSDNKLHDNKDNSAQNRQRSESDAASDSGVECEEMDNNKSSQRTHIDSTTLKTSNETDGNTGQHTTAGCEDQNSTNRNKNHKLRIRKHIPHFLPFSIGKRTCIGQNLVRGFSFIIIANLLQRYNVDISDKSLIKMYSGCVAVPMETYPISLTPRTH